MACSPLLPLSLSLRGVSWAWQFLDPLTVLCTNVMGMRGAASGEGANADVTCLGDRRTVHPSKILRRKGDIYRFLATR